MGEIYSYAAWVKPDRLLGLEDTANEVKKVQDSSIGAAYNLIHEINHKVADLATDLLEQRRGNDILLVEMQ